MKLKAIHILNIYDALMELSDKDNIALCTACDIAKNIQSVSLHKTVIDERRNKLIQDYAVKDDKNEVLQENGQIQIINPTEFSGKMQDLLESEIDIELTRIPKDSLSNIQIAPKHILALIDNILSEV